jgi:hypothetical protein
MVRVALEMLPMHAPAVSSPDKPFASGAPFGQRGIVVTDPSFDQDSVAVVRMRMNESRKDFMPYLGWGYFS